MSAQSALIVLVLALTVVGAAAQDPPPRGDEPAESSVPVDDRLGGAATVRDASRNAFGFPAAVLSATERRAFAVGNAFFKDNWITAPASAAGRDGLGPLFNARSCSSCHLLDGRGRPPGEDSPDEPGLLLRIGIAGEGADRPHPIYGEQLQDRGIAGVAPEIRVRVRYRPRAGRYADGVAFELQEPDYVLENPAYGPLGDDLRLGARVAPQLVGLGLLEAVPEASLLALADPDDEDGDGISGRPHWLVGRRDGVRRLGRFGWKATQPTVAEQVAAAFVQDIGITSSLFPDEVTTETQESVLSYASGGDPEIDDQKLGRVTFYCRTLAVPAQRNASDALVRRGAASFAAFGCARCHVPELRTGDEAVVEAYCRQVIRPYTDLLLHDLGPDLADEKRDGDASSSEWRTPPLWGIGLVPVVNQHTRYLHDGRARNLTEAVLWHGGEAAPAREAFRTAPASARAALIAFLESL